MANSGIRFLMNFYQLRQHLSSCKYIFDYVSEEWSTREVGLFEFGFDPTENEARRRVSNKIIRTREPRLGIVSMPSHRASKNSAEQALFSKSGGKLWKKSPTAGACSARISFSGRARGVNAGQARRTSGGPFAPHAAAAAAEDVAAGSRLPPRYHPELLNTGLRATLSIIF